MSVPKSFTARRYYSVAWKRLEEATVLMRPDIDLRGGAVYLAGYAVECMLKALLVDMFPAKDHEAVERSFRGAVGHSFVWLREQYRISGGPPLPKDAVSWLASVGAWDVVWRYDPKPPTPKEADRFVKAVRAFCTWADGRL